MLLYFFLSESSVDLNKLLMNHFYDEKVKVIYVWCVTFMLLDEYV